MEGGDILYIVVLIVFLLSGLLKKKKKSTEKEQARPMPTFSGKEVTDFDGWFSKKEEVKEVVIQEKTLHEERVLKTYDNTDNFSTLRAQKKNATQVKKTQKSDSIINDYDRTQKIELNTVEEARKAFIYSEIFQRKY